MGSIDYIGLYVILIIVCIVSRYEDHTNVISIYHNDLNLHALPTSLMMITNAISLESGASIELKVDPLKDNSGMTTNYAWP